MDIIYLYNSKSIISFEYIIKYTNYKKTDNQ